MSKEITDNLLSALRKFGLQSTRTQNLFLNSCIVKCYNKNDILFSVDKKNNNEYLLIEGVLHRFNVNEKGENVTTGFYLGNAVVTPHFARTIKGKSIFSLQALTEIIVVEIPVAVLDNLRFINEEFGIFGQKVIEEELSKSILTDIAYRSNNAKERLLLLRQTYPNLENLIPHNIIASYLGITNVSFSRLRSELAKK
ncbi:MAG: Crp/Fnr family transcriptional regulator [Ignavibacteriaceae bacterium]